jgi:hypothetical protein
LQRIQVRSGQGLFQPDSQVAKLCDRVLRFGGRLPHLPALDQRHDLGCAANGVNHQIPDTPAVTIRWLIPTLRRDLLYRIDEKTHRLAGPRADLRGRVVVHRASGL